RLINTSSCSMFGTSYSIPYATAKAAIYTLTRCLAIEGAMEGIRVVGVLPNALTPMTAQIPDEVYVEFKRTYLAVKQVAPFVVWLAHRDTTAQGQCYSIGGGRAAPVVLAEPPGVYREGDGPETWVGQEQALSTLTPLSVPGSMLNEVALNIANLPDE